MWTERKDTPILQGMQIYHNFMRPHEALKGKTPAEACGIEVVGGNKITLIQNAEHQKNMVLSDFQYIPTDLLFQGLFWCLN